MNKIFLFIFIFYGLIIDVNAETKRLVSALTPVVIPKKIKINK